MPEGTLAYIVPVGDGPVDPGFGRPPGGATDPGFGRPPPIGGTLPEPPPGMWPPPSHGNPIGPIIDNTLPVQPGTIWPPVWRPVDPGWGGGPPVHVGGGPADPPSGTLPARPPVRPDAGLPVPPSGTLPVKRLFWMLAYCPSLGWKFVCVDPSLTVGHPLPPAPEPKG